MGEKMNTKDIIKIEGRYTSGVYPKREVAIVKGHGAYIYDSDGKKYIDCVSGIGSVNVGHCNEYVIKAINEQSQKIITSIEIFYNDARAIFLEKLNSVTPESLNRFFLCNSGAEANEAAIKFARVATGRTEIISAKKGFHGRTMGALSATHKPKYRKPFMPLLEGFKFVNYNDIEDLRNNVSENTAAIILEIVQGEGGIILGDWEYFKQVRKLCDEKGIILVIDEVQTGFGRTGKFFACEHAGIVPDIITMAKSIAGGIAMGAVAINDKIQIPRMMHGTTFGGNPIACAAGSAVIDFIKDKNLVEQSRKNGEYLLAELRKIDSPRIKEIRGIGLMIAVDLKERPTPYLKALMERGIMANIAGLTGIRLLPPLVISKEDIDEVVRVLGEVLA